MVKNVQNKKRVVILGNRLEAFGGGERYVLEVASRFQDKYDITIMSPQSSKDFVREKLSDLIKRYNLRHVNILNLECFSVRASSTATGDLSIMMPKPGSINKMRRAVKSADIVYIMSINPVLLSYLNGFARLYRKRMILGLHNPLIVREVEKQNPVGKVLERVLLSSVSEIHAQTETQIKMLKVKNYKGRVYYIPHFMYFDELNKGEKASKSKFNVLFVGRLEIYQKGLDLLKEIVEKTLKMDSSIVFNIVGSGKEGELIVKELERRYPKNVKWYGFLSEEDLKKKYASASLFVMSSRYETPGLSLVEAQSYGTRAVAFNVQGPRDTMKLKEQGMLVKPFDTEAFSEAIVAYHRAYLKDRKGYFKVRPAIKKQIRSMYSVENFVERFQKMLDSDRN